MSKTIVLHFLLDFSLQNLTPLVSQLGSKTFLGKYFPALCACCHVFASSCDWLMKFPASLVIEQSSRHRFGIMSLFFSFVCFLLVYQEKLCKFFQIMQFSKLIEP